VFEGHSHYVMQVVFNPKDTNTFASASLDRTIKVWSIGQPTPNFTLEGHDKGVNCVDYFNGGECGADLLMFRSQCSLGVFPLYDSGTGRL
jgi:WD40 repeat protein